MNVSTIVDGESVIRWTARFAVACYAARLVCDLRGSDPRVARWWWTVGCLWFIAHVVAAFHFQHGWNHAAAFDFTAMRTAEMTGWKSGVGLYVNEAFLGLWMADTCLWWKNLNWPDNRLCYWTVQGLFAFLMFQATAIFGPPFWQPVAALFLAGMLVCTLRSRASNVSYVKEL